MYSILYFDNEPEIQREVLSYFNLRPYIKWFTVLELRQVLDLVYSKQFDLYLLGTNVSLLEQLDLVKALNNLSNQEKPIVILSREKSSLAKQKAFDLGVSNYVEKPLDLDLLSSIIESKLRRSNHNQVAEIKVGALEIDLKSKSCSYRGRSLQLTPTEHLLLFRLAQQPSIVVSKGELCRLLCHDGKYQMSNKALEMHISCLRQKLRDKNLIQTKRGMGYFFKSQI